MPFYEREENLLGILSCDRLTTVDEICQKLYISKPTVRRDLDKLQKKGLIKRAHGGAYLIRNNSIKEAPFRIRESDKDDALSIIAKKAISHIQDGFVIMLDDTESTFSIIPYLSDFKDLLVITNSIKASFVLGQMGIKNISSGGIMHTDTLSCTGDAATDCINKYNADVCFISVKGISPDGFLTDNSEDINSVKKAMLQKSRKKVLLCESNKFDQTYLNNLCHISEFDDVISEYKIPKRYMDIMKER